MPSYLTNLLTVIFSPIDAIFSLIISAIALPHFSQLEASSASTSAGFDSAIFLAKQSANSMNSAFLATKSVSQLTDAKDDVLTKDICLHIASSAPEFVSRADIPAAVIEEETRIEMGKEDLQKKPEQIRAKIVEGRVNKLMAQRCLIEQPFVKNPDMTIEQLITGKLNIVKFDRFVLGEGLEKRNDNFADEVMSQLKG